MDNITKQFKEKKLKVTPQRIAIYRYLMSTTEHPSAETIYNSIKSDYPCISLATVYKTLKTLSESQLIQELNTGENNARYDANTSFHGHIQCTKCGAVEDIFHIDCTSIKEQVENISKYSDISCKFYFKGICSKCQKN